MKWRVLVSAPYMQPALERFRGILEARGAELVVPPVRERLEEDVLLDWIPDIDGVICGDDQFSARVLAAAPRLKVISKWGTGIDSIDVEAARRQGIIVCNTPDAFSEPVADTVLGYILCFARRLPWMAQAMRTGEWQKVPGCALNESVIGVIGVGNVGKAVVRRAVAFGSDVLGTDIRPPANDFVQTTGIRMVPLHELVQRADFVSLNCDLNATSYHLIGQEEFRLMKETAVLINTARGPIVHESALVNALQQSEIAGAALDVFEAEPLPPSSALRQMENVLLAPHNANSSARAWERVHLNTIENLFRALEQVSQGRPTDTTS